MKKEPQQKTIQKNTILNTIRVIATAIFPLITYPYATRILGVNNIGKVQFGLSIVSYFSLIAALGVKTYGSREGAYVRNNRKRFSELASEIFTLNVFSTIASYILLAITLVFVEQLSSYRLLILIQSIVIIFTTVSVEWIYTAEEDFLYITLREIAVQIISLILLFTLVKTESDYYIYAAINVIATAGVGIFNFLHVRSYCNLHLVFTKHLRTHVKPLLMLFASTIAIQIYINSDITMLGLINGDTSVGLYSIPVKVYSIIKNLLNAVIAVSLPRLAFYVSTKKQDQYNNLSTKIIQLAIILSLPAITLISLLSTNIIHIIAGKEYIAGAPSLTILAFALIFAIIANFFGNAVLVSWKREKGFLIATVAGATINIILNLILLPLFSQNGAAITTLIAEAAVALICITLSRDLRQIHGLTHTILQSILGCLLIYVVYFFIHQLNLSYFVELASTGLVGGLSYLIILGVCKNPIFTSFLHQVMKKNIRK